MCTFRIADQNTILRRIVLTIIRSTTCRGHADFYVNWDNEDDRELILSGSAALVEALGLDRLTASVPGVLFDELHKYPRWKQFLKGFFDVYGEQLRIIVTGSSRLEVYRRGGDSLMGRYLSYRMHPFSVAESLTKQLPDPVRVVRKPKKPKAKPTSMPSGCTAAIPIPTSSATRASAEGGSRFEWSSWSARRFAT